MGLFNSIMSKIFGQSQVAASRPVTTFGGSDVAGAVGTQTLTAVDVVANLDRIAANSSEKLEWRESIVDLMKLVGMDSSLSARKQLATELRYGGDQGDSAAMNLWLHKAVLKKLSENGGKVPQELLS